MATEALGRGGNINDWATGLQSLDLELSKQLDEARIAGFERAERLGLPVYRRATQPLLDFITQPASTLQEIGSAEFYITLFATNGKAPRFSKSGLPAQEVIDYVHTQIARDQMEDYTIVTQEFFKNLYGGNIVINPSGNVWVEFSAGKQAPISRGTATPEFTANNNNFSRIFRYSFDDPGLRTLIWGTLMRIPHAGYAREMDFTPGYYEFAIVEKPDGAPPAPIFIDYNNSPAFHLPEENM